MLRFLIVQGADPKVRNRSGEKNGLSSLEAVERSKSEKIKHAVLGETKSKLNKRTQKRQPRSMLLDCLDQPLCKISQVH